ncbi:class I SAM-dependent methyltransferase [Aliikangiella sp. G2MR2-5]|uniref:class I SAM-dependent methyltransferase n=1 Tax=Aliikangiella sp. G2MR2-5 TaxID=2788943 RepID=UPI0018AB5768|nr:class I SAM-dependent methyltransferase [Aliikangiella sp. G2MR2-5]
MNSLTKEEKRKGRVRNRLGNIYVDETGFGKWFLRTHTWKLHVLERALKDLEQLIPDKKANYDTVVDVGCGYGHSLPKLKARFSPQRLIGLDISEEMIEATEKVSIKNSLNAELILCSSEKIPLEDNSVDLLFCHQTFHHIIEQEKAIDEFYRILKPGGIFLFAESTKRYINSYLIRYLFRHPMKVQKTAQEYIELIRSSGFRVSDESISLPFLWWSREDLGIRETLLGIAPPQKREETLVNLVATK